MTQEQTKWLLTSKQGGFISGGIYQLDEGLKSSQNKAALINALRQWLFTQWKAERRQYETIPFEKIKFSLQEETKYEFQMDGAQASTDFIDDQVYLLRISQQICMYISKLSSELREEWKERELIRAEVEIDRQQPSFKAKDNQNYREMLSATIAGMDVHLLNFDSVRDWYILSNLRHNNIVPWYGMVKINNVMYAAIQKLTVTLESYLNSNFGVQRTEDLLLKLRIITQIGYGIAFMHMKGISLMNITPWSIFIDESTGNRPVIYDLDLAIRADKQAAPWITYFKEGNFASPEAISKKNNTNFINSDIYSYGILAYYILTGKFPGDAIECQIASDSELDRDIKVFIGSMMQGNECSRPSAKVCYEAFEVFNARL